MRRKNYHSYRNRYRNLLRAGCQVQTFQLMRSTDNMIMVPFLLI